MDNQIYLKTLILKNFQKHSDLTLDLNKSVNVIVGNTGSGKSCIVRALRWILFCDLDGDDILKEGTKKTSVKVIFSNGTELERVKSKTVNRYILTINEEEKIFDSIGRTIPEEIQKVIGYNLFEIDGKTINLNIANQIGLPFLLNESGSFRNKLFNCLTGADKIDNAMSSLNKDILELNREEKSNQEFIDNNKDKLESYQTKIALEKELLGKLSEKIRQLSDKIGHYNAIKEKKNSLFQIDDKIVNLQKQEVKIPDIDLKNLDSKIERLEQLNEHYLKLKQLKIDFNNLKDKLENLKIPEINKTRLEENIEKINKYKKIIESLNDITIKSSSLLIDLGDITKELEKSKKTYKEILRQNKICDYCKQELTEKHIKEIKL